MPRKTQRKPEKFPLTLHRKTGQWCRAFTLPSGRRKVVYFGKNRDEALAKYVAERDEWQAGRNPRETRAVVTTDATIADVVNHYLDSQQQRLESGDIKARTLHENRSVCERLTAALGRNRIVSTLTAADFERFKADMAKTNSALSVAQIINKCRSPFKYCVEAGILDKLPMFGPHFKTPGKRAIREAKNARPNRLFEADELRKIIDAVDPPLKAWILLGVNCGYGAADIATLPRSAIDLEGGWIVHARAKTATQRKCPLWPETVEAIREALAVTPEPRNPVDAELAFLNTKGNPLVNESETGTRQDTVGKWFRELLVSLKIERPGVGHYSLRHSFRTVADEVGDDRAVRTIMGHVEDERDMGSHYVHRIDDERLRKVTDHVRAWLFPKPKKPRRKKPAPAEKPQLRIVG